jgi:putative FmdB family regulatory protein
MPIYEYKCSDCGTKFDVIRLIKDADAPINCQTCNGLNTSRSISLFYAQSGERIVAGDVSRGCSNCSGGSCSACNK